MVQKPTSIKSSKTTLNPTKVMKGTRKCNKKGGLPASFFLCGALKTLISTFLKTNNFDKSTKKIRLDYYLT